MQNIIDDLKKTFSTTAQIAVQKSGEIYERSKILLAITGTQNDIEREYSAIGKIIFAGFRNDEVSSEEVTSKCELIETKMQEISELRAKLAVLKNIKTCPMCDAEVSSSSAYCAKCGQQL